MVRLHRLSLEIGVRRSEGNTQSSSPHCCDIDLHDAISAMIPGGSPIFRIDRLVLGVSITPQYTRWRILTKFCCSDNQSAAGVYGRSLRIDPDQLKPIGSGLGFKVYAQQAGPYGEVIVGKAGKFAAERSCRHRA